MYAASLLADDLQLAARACALIGLAVASVYAAILAFRYVRTELGAPPPSRKPYSWSRPPVAVAVAPEASELSATPVAPSPSGAGFWSWLGSLWSFFFSLFRR